ncbi:GntR family transcriptional regulator [Bailinhaonella thermotolerans]|nr:GntR family transcriptional regulator [Bailinhaonella thermotolerans]
MSAAERHPYEEIAHELLSAIERGEFTAGDRLPSEKELQVRHDASRDTVRRALRVLIDRGVATPRRKVGVFVRGYDRQVIEAGLVNPDEANAHLEVATVHPPDRVAAFAPGAGSMIRRRRRPASALIDSYFLRELVSRIPELGEPDPLPEADVTLMKQAGIKLDETRTRVLGRMPTSAEAELLDLPPGTPVLEQTTPLMQTDGRVIAVRIALFAGDRNELEFDLRV